LHLAYSFRFPVLGSVQLSCVLRQIIHVRDDGHVSTYIRGAITDIFKYDQAFLRLLEYRDEPALTLRVNNPAVFVFRACQYADTFGNRVIVDRCIDNLKDIEGELGNPDLTTDLSARLNELSKELGQVRICIQYVKAAATTMLLHLGNERERNFAIIQGDITDIGPGWPDRLMDDLQHSEVGVDTLLSISSMEKTCDQRLLDVELIQRRADNALMVVNSPFIRFIGLLLILHLQVTNLLAQKEIEWQHSMENSQKTIAIVTMFFLPATFFAVSRRPHVFYSFKSPLLN
jgi:hypothetical protein